MLRSAVFGGRPNRLRCGRWGEITSHSASVTSLEYRKPFRSYCGRVISVHMWCLADCWTQPLKHNSLKSLSSFRSASETRGFRFEGRRDLQGVRRKIVEASSLALADIK